MKRDQLELARLGMRLEHTQIGDHHAWPLTWKTRAPARIAAVQMAGRRDEVELLDEGALALTQDDEDLARRCRDFGRAAGPWQPHFRLVVGTDHRGVDIGEAIDLRGAEKADVDAPALQPVTEHFRHRHHGIGGRRELAIPDRKRQHVRLGADGAGFVDQHDLGRVRQSCEVGRSARQPDADKADHAALQQARGRDRHHFIGGVGRISHGTPASTDRRRCFARNRRSPRST